MSMGTGFFDIAVKKPVPLTFLSFMNCFVAHFFNILFSSYHFSYSSFIFFYKARGRSIWYKKHFVPNAPSPWFILFFAKVNLKSGLKFSKFFYATWNSKPVLIAELAPILTFFGAGRKFQGLTGPILPFNLIFP